MDKRVVGAVQPALCTKKNGLHRAEVEKLMVHSEHRSAGIGRAPMDAIEQRAEERGRKLLVLDTRSGDVASALYPKCGYVEAGQIPGYAASASGRLDATSIFARSCKNAGPSASSPRRTPCSTSAIKIVEHASAPAPTSFIR
jgi:acetyltransferase